MLSVERRNILRYAQLSFDVFLVVFYFVVVFAMATSVPADSSDFAKFYKSAEYFWKGTSIYADVPIDAFGPLPEEAEVTRETLHPNLNPPFQTLLIAPLGLLEYSTAFSIWSAISLFLGIAGFNLIIADTNKDRRGHFNRFLTPFLLYYPTLIAIIFGQLSLVLLFFIAILWKAARTDRDVIAGIALGLIVSIKLFVGLFWIFFLVRRRWKILTSSLITFAVCGFTSLLVFGPETYWEYKNVLDNVNWYGANWNASFMGFFSRIFGGSENIPLINMPTLTFTLTLSASLVIVTCLIWLAWPRRHETGTMRFDVSFVFAAVAMLLLSPLGWMYYFPVILPFLFVTWTISQELLYSNLYKLLLTVIWGLSTLPTALLPSEELNHPVTWFTWAAIYFYSLLFLTGNLVALGSRLSDREICTLENGVLRINSSWGLLLNTFGKANSRLREKSE